MRGCAISTLFGPDYCLFMAINSVYFCFGCAAFNYYTFNLVFVPSAFIPGSTVSFFNFSGYLLPFRGLACFSVDICIGVSFLLIDSVLLTSLRF